MLYFWHSLGNRFLTLLSNMLTDLNLTDMETCYKVFRDRDEVAGAHERSVRVRARDHGKIAQARSASGKCSISYSGRTYAEGKKIGWRDGIAAVWHILRFNLFPPPRALEKSAVTHNGSPSGERSHLGLR